MNPSKPPPPGTPPPSPPPPGPRHPVPTGPGPGRFVDDLMALADAVFQTPARQGHIAAAVEPHEHPGGPVGYRPIREESPTSPSVVADSEGRAGLTPPGAVPFTLPPARGVPRFGDGRPTPGHPPTPPKPQGPVPHPPPPVTGVDSWLN